MTVARTVARTGRDKKKKREKKTVLRVFFSKREFVKDVGMLCGWVFFFLVNNIKQITINCTNSELCVEYEIMNYVDQ